MLVIGIKPGHDGSIAVVKDRHVLFSLESEKDSFERHAPLTPMTIFDAIELAGEAPDVIAMGGWEKEFAVTGHADILTGYRGARGMGLREATLWGKPTKLFSSTHVRSHIMMGAGMAPADDAELRAVLVWEGAEGSFFLLDDRWQVVREVPVLEYPGGRYVLPYGIAYPWYSDYTVAPDGEEAES
jgi:hydroxymethyl cephem carbamoyltransferase